MLISLRHRSATKGEILSVAGIFRFKWVSRVTSKTVVSSEAKLRNLSLRLVLWCKVCAESPSGPLFSEKSIFVALNLIRDYLMTEEASSFYQEGRLNHPTSYTMNIIYRLYLLIELFW